MENLEFPEGRGGIFCGSILENPEERGGGGGAYKIRSMGEVWIFSGTTQYKTRGA